MSAQILPFTPRAKAVARRDAGGNELPAIVIFPGVRYERLPDDYEPMVKPAAHQAH